MAINTSTNTNIDPKLPRNIIGAADFSEECTADTTADLGGGEERG